VGTVLHHVGLGHVVVHEVSVVPAQKVFPLQSPTQS
jgi:hypothetical protein